MLEVRNVSAAYGTALALRSVTLRVDRGEIVSLIGANGAGKTTTLRVISGILKPISGEVIMDGRNISGMEPFQIASLGLVHVPEGRGLFPEMTVLENLEMGSYLRKDKEGIRRDLEFVYSLFPVLKEREKQLAGTLSGGEQQMLAIAKGLMGAPKLLLLDEPSLGLSPIMVERIFDAISQVNKERGISILIAEQNAYMALSMSYRAYVIENGSTVMEGSGRELLGNDYVRKAYLGI
ncbi:MAG: ABC transporter ATP-binding protein [Candidatus Korarchaeum sp.]|nr:ABC transporter ATP-binding protein [Candidatus Korarchaeum sp.]MDW8035550.1 ABC transporter ATP-binding protein [Candidatus Korarchaeum sp.]